MAVPPAPDWISTAFFQSCLQTHEKQPLTVTKYTVKPTDIPEGSNYGSQIIRVTVDYKTGDANCSTGLIIKCPVANVKQFLGGVYEIEELFYKVFVNETYKYSKHDIIPLYYVSPIPQIVILEDLSISGYKMVDRRNFLDFEHCQLFVKAKAKLHAMSIAVHRDNPKIIESVVKESPKHKENREKMTKQMMNGSLQCVVAFFEDNSINNEYMDVIKEAINNDNLWEIYQEVEDYISKKSLKALIQLDPWCTNMMFKYDNLGRVDNIKLLDFQALAFTSPLKEIVTFMSLCPNIEVRKTKSTELFHLYLDTLNENLAELQCQERLTHEEMMTDIATLAPWLLFLTCSSVAFVMAEGAADIGELITGDMLNAPIRESSLYRLYQNNSFINLFPQFLDTIAKEGVFDYVKEKFKQRKSS